VCKKDVLGLADNKKGGRGWGIDSRHLLFILGPPLPPTNDPKKVKSEKKFLEKTFQIYPKKNFWKKTKEHCFT
jgi:hypothetical protein